MIEPRPPRPALRARLVSAVTICSLIGAGVATGAEPSAAAPLHLVARYPVGGHDTGYDLVRLDAARRRLYVAHGNGVEVLDADSGRLVGRIEGTHGVHGIEIVPALGKGYTTDGQDRAITVFDLGTLQVRERIKYTGVKPDALAYDSDSGFLYVVNGGSSGDVTVVDPVHDSIVGTIDLGGTKLEMLGFDGRSHGFVNDEDRNVVHVFDTRTQRAVATWPLAPCEGPTALAVDAAHHRLFSACGNHRLAVLDSDDGRIVAMAPIGGDPDGAYFDAPTQRLFTSNRDGTLTVLHEASPDRYEVLQTVPTEPGARTLAFDPGTGRLFLPTARLAAPAAAGGPRAIVPESFVVLVVGT